MNIAECIRAAVEGREFEHGVVTTRKEKVEDIISQLSLDQETIAKMIMVWRAKMMADPAKYMRITDKTANRITLDEAIGRCMEAMYEFSQSPDDSRDTLRKMAYQEMSWLSDEDIDILHNYHVEMLG